MTMRAGRRDVHYSQATPTAAGFQGSSCNHTISELSMILWRDIPVGFMVVRNGEARSNIACATLRLRPPSFRLFFAPEKRFRAL
jgi:hypothetical protein